MNEKTDENILRSAQYRKSLSIAFFSSTNAAIELVKPHSDEINIKDDLMQNEIIKWRNWFLKEHKKYYAENIANIGKPYDTKETVEKLEVETTLEGLKKAWVLLSEDERRDGAIIEEVKKLKAQLTK